MIKGYAINKKRLEALNRTVEIQSRIIASTLELDEKEVLNVIKTYADALSLLDDYTIYFIRCKRIICVTII